MYDLNRSVVPFWSIVGALTLVVAFALLLSGCNEKKAPTSTQQIAGWTGMYGTVGRCDDFNFGEPHYCVNRLRVGLGQVIRIKVTVSGDLKPTQGDPPAKLRLFLWRAGDDLSCSGGPQGFQGYRYWSVQAIDLTPGTHELAVPVDATHWTDCYAKSDPTAFAGTVNNLYAVGYTFGGQFAGHGVVGTGHFHLDWFTVE